MSLSYEKLRHGLASVLGSVSLWVLLAGFGLTGWLAARQHEAVEARTTQRFERITSSYAHQIESRLQELATLVRATDGYFTGSEHVTPEEFTHYARRLDLRRFHAGIQGLGYAVWLPQSERAAFEAAQRALDPAFRSWPRCAGTHFSSIVRLEPLDWRNRRAIGFDMHCEATRRAAMQDALASEEPRLSGMVRLVQEKDRPQPGVLLYQALQDARGALRGWVYLPIRIGDMLQALSEQDPSRRDFEIRVRDAAQPAQGWNSYATDDDGLDWSQARSTTLALYGQHWQLEFLPTAEFQRTVSYAVVGYALAAGSGASLLLAGAVAWQARARRRAEQLARSMTRDLSRREAELQTLFAASPDATLIVDGEGRVVRHNPAARTLFGYSEAELLGISVDALVPEAQRAAHRGFRERYAGAPRAREMGSGRPLAARRADGSVFRIEILLAPLDFQGAPHVLVVARDVSGRVEQEAQRAAMLAEKELLLQEVHHRVKNNLQVIHSLFDLQKDAVADPAAREALADAQSRVRAMALIHQVLYQSRDFGEVDFAAYLELLLRDLGTSLGRPEVVVQSAVEPVKMTLERAIPCGLLMSEAVSNAFKHAFPGERPGHVALTLKRVGGGVEMAVADDGVGLPADWRSRETLGMRLIVLLAEQCGARLDIHDTHPGTRLVLRWDEPAEQGAPR